MKRLNLSSFAPFALLCVVTMLWIAAIPAMAQDATLEAIQSASVVIPVLENLPPAEPNLSAFPVTVENCGRELTFEAPPERVISLWQPPTEMLLAIGVAPEQFVALAGSYAPYPDVFAPIVDSIPAIGTAMAWPAREVLLAEQPDFVISEGLEGFGYDPAQGYATVAEIEAAGAQVYANAFCTLAEPRPGTIDNVLNDIRNLGAIFGLSERAEALIAAMEAERRAVVEAVADEEPVTVAFYNGGEGPLFVLSTDVWADLIETAGGINVFEGVETFTVSVEEFAAADPDVILVGTFPGQEAEPLIRFLQTTFPSLQAVQNDRLYPLATIDTENSIRVTQGLTQMAQALHPEAFANATSESTSVPAAMTQTQYPVTIENCGRTLTFDAPPQRVVATYHTAATLLIDLGLGERLFGLMYSDYLPPNAENIDELRAIENLAPQAMQREVLLSLEPDLVLSSYFNVDFDASVGAATLEDLEQANIPAYGLSVECTDRVTDGNMELVFNDLRNLGIIFNRQAEFNTIIEQMQARLSEIEARVAGREPVTAMWYTSGEGPYRGYANGIYGDMLNRAGAVSVFQDMDITFFSISAEEIVGANPDWFVALDWRPTVAYEEIANILTNSFAATTAGANEQIIWLPEAQLAYLNLVDGIETLARAFHPDAFTDATPEAIDTSTAAAQTQYPVTIETCGRTITVDAPPQRVYTTYWNGFDLLARLGLVDRIIGNAFQGDYDGGDLAEQYAQIPNQYERYPAAEEALALQADLVIASYDTFDFPPETLSIEDWTASGVPVYSMSTECGGGDATQARYEMFFDDVRNIGIIFNVQAEAEALIAEMEGRLAAVQAAVGDAEPVRAMIYYGGEGPLNVFTNGVYGSIIELAGGQTVFPDAERTVEEVSPEVVATLAPEAYLIIPWTDTFENLRSFLYTTFPDAPASINDRALLMPDGTTPAGYRTIEAIEQLAQMLHPEAFE